MVATTRVDGSFLSVPVTAWVVTLILLAAGFAFYSLLNAGSRGMPRATVGVLILSSAFGNVMYLGLPLITGMLGAEHGYVAVLYDLLATTPLLFTLGVFMAARYGSGKEVSLASSIRRVLRLPPLWGVGLGLAFNLGGAAIPQAVLDAMELMGRAVIPIMIFTVGLALDFGELKKLPAALPAIGIKLFLSPLLAWWTGSRLGIAGDTLKAVVIEGAMPVMVVSLIIADEFDLDVQLAATCIAVSTLASFFTVPLMMKILF